MNKRGQIAIFVIIAVVIIAAAIGIFIFRDAIFSTFTTSKFSEVYETYDDCIEQTTLRATEIAGMQGGYIELPEFEPGNEKNPFSSQLDFLGIGVPYWYYVSRSGDVKEQVPSMNLIENQIEDFLESELRHCDFSSFRAEGIVIELDELDVKVNVRDSRIDVDVRSDLVVEKGDLIERKREHDVRVDTDFGEVYKLAKDVYSKEKSEMFLENYAVDVMYNYAPVTGSEISCSPKVWNPREVFDDLKNGLSANVGALKLEGNYYELDDKEDEYFVVDINSNTPTRFLYDESWPTRIEVWPAENSLMVAEPVGLEQGLGILGFCYVPYHFVYDIYFPVLVQIQKGDAIFQFPVSVVVDKSMPRNSLDGNGNEGNDLDEFCNYKNTQVRVSTYDSDIEPLEADINFVCLQERCSIGKTGIQGSFSADFPQCVNGRVVASADGFLSESQYIDTNTETSVELILSKLYEVDLELLVSGRGVDEGGIVIVRFEGERHGTTAAYPEQETISLVSDELYNVSVSVFSGRELRIPASSTRQCVEIPAGGLMGIFGKTNEECFEVEMPATTLENSLSAGGNSLEIFSEGELKSAGKLKINIPSLPTVRDLEQVQQNYELIESNYLEVDLR